MFYNSYLFFKKSSVFCFIVSVHYFLIIEVLQDTKVDKRMVDKVEEIDSPHSSQPTVSPVELWVTEVITPS